MTLIAKCPFRCGILCNLTRIGFGDLEAHLIEMWNRQYAVLLSQSCPCLALVENESEERMRHQIWPKTDWLSWPRRLVKIVWHNQGWHQEWGPEFFRPDSICQSVPLSRSVSYVVIHRCRPLGLEKPQYWYWSSEFPLLYVGVSSDQEIWEPVLPGEAETMVFRHRCFTAVSGPPSSGTFAQLLFQFFLQASMLHSSFRAAKQWGIPTSTEEDEQVWSPLNNNFHRSKSEQELI